MTGVRGLIAGVFVATFIAACAGGDGANTGTSGDGNVTLKGTPLESKAAFDNRLSNLRAAHPNGKIMSFSDWQKLQKEHAAAKRSPGEKSPLDFYTDPPTGNISYYTDTSTGNESCECENLNDCIIMEENYCDPNAYGECYTWDVGNGEVEGYCWCEPCYY